MRGFGVLVREGSRVRGGSQEVRWFARSARSVHGGIGEAGVRSFRDLDCWKLAYELKLGVYALVKAGGAARDFSFREQIMDAAASAPRNIAEAFGRYEPTETRQYLRVATGSLMETSNHLQDGVDRGYFQPAEIEPLLVLARRASAATAAWIRYLKTARAPRPRTREP